MNSDYSTKVEQNTVRLKLNVGQWTVHAKGTQDIQLPPKVYEMLKP